RVGAAVCRGAWSGPWGERVREPYGSRCAVLLVAFAGRLPHGGGGGDSARGGHRLDGRHRGGPGRGDGWGSRHPGRVAVRALGVASLRGVDEAAGRPSGRRGKRSWTGRALLTG